MKKAIAYWYFFLLVLLTFSTALVSCGSKKQKSTTVQKDSINNKEKYTFRDQTIKSLAINDKLTFKFPIIITGATIVKDCDSLCNEKIKEALSNVETSKESGNNSYKIYYDKFKNQIVINVKQGETIDKYKDSIVEKDKLIEKYKNQVKIVPEKHIPKLILYLAIFGAFSLASLITYLIIKGIKLVRIIKLPI